MIEEADVRPYRIVRGSLCLALAALAGACGTKDLTGPALNFSLQEVYALAGELGGAMSGLAAADIRAGLAAPRAGAPARSVALATPFKYAAGCPGGGTTSVSGSYDSTTTVTADSLRTTNYQASATFSYDGCKTAHYTTSGSFTATGRTSLILGFRAAAATVGGTLSVSTVDGRSGTCVLDVNVSTAVDQVGNTSYVVSGTACGANVSGRY